ncbi:acyltransferase family protein [Devosia salina]|uniref:Acyltransferase 3 domain-containing protein n=1 Tax=Devosia salina TaxID=2860336 RepID=A0ABX8WGB8_9HYPH|nr:hypothetical protein [Devosia salina]QYO77786.1 hypothetical protein K1X15_04245 [Devosia salina]
MGALVYWFASRRHFTPGPLVELAVAGALIASLAAPAGLNAITTPGAVLLTGMLLAGSRQGSLVGNALSAAPLVSVGRLSYSLYLWHWPALIIGKWTIGTSALAVCLCLLVGFVLACLSYWLVERPIRTLRHSVLSALAVVCLLGALWPAFYFTSTIAPAQAQSANNFLPAMFKVPPPPAMARG